MRGRLTLRSIGAILGSVLVGVIVIAAVEALSTVIYPLPAGFDPKNTEAMRAHIASLPIGAFLFVLAAWGLGSFTASWMAGRRARSRDVWRGVTREPMSASPMTGAARSLPPHLLRRRWRALAGIVFYPSASQRRSASSTV
jgi:hypothetical protein